jgi:hypothetical protein
MATDDMTLKLIKNNFAQKKKFPSMFKQNIIATCQRDPYAWGIIPMHQNIILDHLKNFLFFL